jgi:capsular polysaccharide biosynthesis protein
MKSNASNRHVHRLTVAYRQLVTLYPREHQRRYGRQMVVHFQDLCREAANSGTFRAHASLVLSVILDSFKSLTLEHFNSLTGCLMNMKFPNPFVRSLCLATTVFTMLLLFTVCMAFLMPRKYMSHSRIIVDGTGSRPAAALDPAFVETEIERITSRSVLDEVAGRLDLPLVWADRLMVSPTDPRPGLREAVERLQSRLVVRRFRNTGMIEIMVTDEDREMAARIANLIAETYREHTQPQGVLIVDAAEPGLAPISPNVPLVVALGILAAGAASMTVGALQYLRLSHGTIGRS